MHKKAAVKEAYLVFVFVHVYGISLPLSTAVALQMSFFMFSGLWFSSSLGSCQFICGNTILVR